MSKITFNARPLPDFVNVTGITFSSIGDISVRESSVPGRIGTIDSGIDRGAKNISLTCQLMKQGGNIHDRADELKRWAKGDNWRPSRLIFTEQPDFYLNARVTNAIDIDELFAIGETSIDFHAADPIKYKITKDVIYAETGTVAIDYRGIEDAPVIIDVPLGANASRIVLEHATTGNKLIIEGEMHLGDTISVDSDKKVIRVNDEVNMNLLNLSSKGWLYLLEGDNALTVQVDDAPHAFTTTYQERR